MTLNLQKDKIHDLYVDNAMSLMNFQDEYGQGTLGQVYPTRDSWVLPANIKLIMKA